MDKKRVIKYFKIIVTVGLVILGIYYVALRPYVEFKQNEKLMEEAAKRYYYLNEDKLPTGDRIDTITLKELYRGKYVDKDIYLPYGKEPCSVENSWVKVRNVDNNYKYYTYLECGVLKSKTDHDGPKITLNGEDEVTIYNGEEYKELGVKSVNDATDGAMDNSDVVIDSSKVDTSKNGTYDVTYTAVDVFNNKTVKVRKVNVIETIKHVVEKIVAKDGYVKGEIENNNVVLSGIEFKIVSLKDDKVKLVSSYDLSNVNYGAIDKWLEGFYENLTDEAKAFIVEDKYCNDTVKKANILKTTSCSGKGENKKIYILSVADMNNSVDSDGNSYLYPETMSWLANKTSKINAVVTRTFFGSDNVGNYALFDQVLNFGVRPAITIKGDTQIISGDGSIDDPYVFGETNTGKSDEYLNTRHMGEYILISGRKFRIVDVEEDETTKVILYEHILNKISYNTKDKVKLYNPKEKGNIGYKISSIASKNIDSSFFVTKNTEVPIYKSNATYKGEGSTEKYKVKFAAPDMYDIFSAAVPDENYSYWLKNSSQELRVKYVVSDIGVVYYGVVPDDMEANIRVVGYLNKDVKILSGKGTFDSPYKIVK